MREGKEEKPVLSIVERLTSGGREKPQGWSQSSDPNQSIGSVHGSSRNKVNRKAIVVY